MIEWLSVDLGMADKSDMCEYELKRLERIKANRKMLEDLFPEGTTINMPRPPKKRKSIGRRVSLQGSLGGSSSGESTPEKGTPLQKKGSLYSAR